jgi:group II intron reverse transcriptase/maturase
MLPATVHRRLAALPQLSKQGKRINGLFRLLESPDVWRQAYAKIHANAGATTKGVDDVTMDGFSMERVANIIELLKEGRYRCKPVRRVYIPKTNGKRRPLGIPSGDDKLVQEVVRSLLELIYEPIFSDRSHGFRPHRSCHTALQEVERWDGVKWLLDVDIQSFYDTIDHNILITLLEKRIDDRRFINLIKAMLKAGYMEDWHFHNAYSGTPQGGIVSPILANGYLHELDGYMEQVKEAVDKGKRRRGNPEYHRLSNHIYNLRRQIRGMQENGRSESPRIQEMKRQIKALDSRRKALPSVNLYDTAYRRLYYCRYADDVLIGIIGNKAEARWVMARVRDFLHTALHLHLAEAKSTIRHAKEGTSFLGYEVLTRSSDKLVRERRGQTHTLCRTVAERMRLRIPEKQLRRCCHQNGYGNYESCRAVHRPAWGERSDAEVILAYNAELRGLANYYSLAYSAKSRLAKLYYLWRTSLVKTLAAKHRTTVAKIARRLRKGNDFVYAYPTKGMQRHLKVFSLKDLRQPEPGEIDIPPNVSPFTLTRTEIVRRLNAETCEYCGTTKGYFEVHHVRKLKDVTGKALWQQMMAAMRRKTMVLCVACHHQLHSGSLPDWRYRSQMKVESRIHRQGERPVREGVDGRPS